MRLHSDLVFVLRACFSAHACRKFAGSASRRRNTRAKQREKDNGGLVLTDVAAAAAVCLLWSS